MENISLKTYINDILEVNELRFKNLREEIMKLMKDEEELFTPKYNVSSDEMKRLSFAKIKKILRLNKISLSDIKKDPKKVLVVHELLNYVDTCATTKLACHLVNFGGTILNQGGNDYEYLVKDIDNLEIFGAFFLTELGFGNNTSELETVATWDNQKKCFFINSPTVGSHKIWGANGGRDANFAIVIAQTVINNNNEGVHPFLVQIRNSKHELCDGVYIEDLPKRILLDGIDSCRVIFKKFSCPHQSLLRGKATFDPLNAEYKSPIKSKKQRFFNSISGLMLGRLAMSEIMISTTKLILLITIKFSRNRFAINSNGKVDLPIHDLGIFKYQIIPQIIHTLFISIGFIEAKTMFENFCKNNKSLEEKKMNNFINAIKSMISWNTCKTGILL